MKRRIFIYKIIGVFTIITIGCEKDKISSNGKVELYLLESYSSIENSFQIDETTIMTEAFPLINYSDFVSYDSTNYTFELSHKAKNTINNMEHSIEGVAFAVKANGTLIYSGYFWPSYSSATCDWIVIDPIMTSIGNKITVSLGYPGLVQEQVIPDYRNDSRIIEIFDNDNKLID